MALTVVQAAADWAATAPPAPADGAVVVIRIPPEAGDPVARMAVQVLAEVARPRDPLLQVDATTWAWWACPRPPTLEATVRDLNRWGGMVRGWQVVAVPVPAGQSAAASLATVADALRQATAARRASAPRPRPPRLDVRQVDLAALIAPIVPLKKRGDLWVGRCPFHDDHEPSFTVYPPPNAHYYCFGCHVWGDARTWLQQQEGLQGAALRRRLQAVGAAPLAAPGRPGDAWGGQGALAAWIAVYADLWPQLTLEPAHRALLRARGLDDAAIDAHAFRSLPPLDQRTGWMRKLAQAPDTPRSLVGIPGFSTKHFGTLHGRPGLLCPVRDRTGQIIGAQIRVDDPGPDGEGGRYRWWSTPPDRKGADGRVLYPGGAASGALATLATPGAEPWPADTPADTVWITEGILKAIVAVEQLGGDLVIGVPGVAQIGAGLGLLADLEPRRVILAWDADPAGQAAVPTAVAAVRHLLPQTTVQVARWTGTKGLDDALVAGVPITVDAATGGASVP